ncbi:ABC transporter permease [Mycolicibacterium confluentis]|uniref:ABC transporter n=1 Tax=Mycolicibacterium confluentis TaxID=28047 RepID=A0A7I7XYV8_9MYCO|nr:ABC transporter permease [Mycolicibacterium confluentis]MCV7319459.1 ABC transporter permease [Mycolicibacterium confluentis]ORV34095.1 ABC transporter [Mycolicibacterium confluentis]BBZ34477.1 ABC transporter [Mycolicibacterium confluentis]
MSAAPVIRGVRAEMVRTAGRSRLWTVLVPAAVAMPLVITFAIAAAAEMFARIPGQISVLQVPTSNAAYWVITITTVVVAIAASDGQASESRYRAGEYVRLAMRRQWPALLGRWLFYGVLGAVVAAVTLLAVLLLLPVASPLVYGAVSATDPVALRLLWTVPLLSFFAAGAGVGIGALIPSPLGAAAVILLWVYAVESAAGYLPSGAFLQRFMPVLNGVFATGQDAVLTPPWGQNAALLYVCSLFTAMFLVATIERTVRHG